MLEGIEDAKALANSGKRVLWVAPSAQRARFLMKEAGLGPGRVTVFQRAFSRGCVAVYTQEEIERRQHFGWEWHASNSDHPLVLPMIRGRDNA